MYAALKSIISFFWCAREESNLDYKLRKLESYPLNDERLFNL